ncbi:hypothetical protein RRG08_046020 [Elysia crispata]|uniref:Uncharacterized protein n=1 Tax=Elysia crispata TaxID=231223 RepID=A0AAE1DDH9_9GAST|nr:hypothetical protein RRG08_046020 [Elysia crispata]
MNRKSIKHGNSHRRSQRAFCKVSKPNGQHSFKHRRRQTARWTEETVSSRPGSRSARENHPDLSAVGLGVRADHCPNVRLAAMPGRFFPLIRASSDRRRAESGHWLAACQAGRSGGHGCDSFCDAAACSQQSQIIGEKGGGDLWYDNDTVKTHRTGTVARRCSSELGHILQTPFPKSVANPVLALPVDRRDLVSNNTLTFDLSRFQRFQHRVIDPYWSNTCEPRVNLF